jgi:transposase-like protein
MLNITDPVFHDEEKARKFLEDERWPAGIVCPFCNKQEGVASLNGQSMGPGWYYCNSCDQKKFTLRTGSVMERSHVPLAKWAMAIRLMAASKKGVSSKQLQRMLGVSYKTAWFISHRLRTAMSPSASPVGGDEKIVEADETFVGGRSTNRRKGKGPVDKVPVVALVERRGEMRAKVVPDVTAKTLREVLATQASRESYLMTDDSAVYFQLGKDFYSHSVVKHGERQYSALGGFAHTNTVESFFGLLKRGITGSFHSVSEQHLQRYVDEFAFRWNTRSALGVEDVERASLIVKGAVGKRLTYRRPDEAAQSGQADA